MKTKQAWTLCVLWMAFIFLMSALPGDVSGAQSGSIAQLLLGLLSPLLGKIDPDRLEWLLRKAAHMAEYAILFLLYRRALRLSQVRHAVPAALLLSAAYAATDEFHQSFVAGRGPSITDVAIDTIGAGLCALLTDLFPHLLRRFGHGEKEAPHAR